MTLWTQAVTLDHILWNVSLSAEKSPSPFSKDVTVFIKWFVLKLKNGPSWLSSLGVICK